MIFLIVPCAYGGLILLFNHQEDQQLKAEWGERWKEKRRRRHYRLWSNFARSIQGKEVR